MNGDGFGSAHDAEADVHRWDFALFLGAGGAHGLHICQRDQKHSLLKREGQKQESMMAAAGVELAAAWLAVGAVL